MLCLKGGVMRKCMMEYRSSSIRVVLRRRRGGRGDVGLEGCGVSIRDRGRLGVLEGLEWGQAGMIVL